MDMPTVMHQCAMPSKVHFFVLRSCFMYTLMCPCFFSKTRYLLVCSKVETVMPRSYDISKSAQVMCQAWLVHCDSDNLAEACEGVGSLQGFASTSGYTTRPTAAAVKSGATCLARPHQLSTELAVVMHYDSSAYRRCTEFFMVWAELV